MHVSTIPAGRSLPGSSRSTTPPAASRCARPGPEPGSSVNLHVAAVLANRGLSTDAEVPTLLTRDVAQGADVVVTMGCGETCPVFPGKRYLDWEVDDPAGQDRDTVERIVDDIDSRVRALLADLGVEGSSIVRCSRGRVGRVR